VSPISDRRNREESEKTESYVSKIFTLLSREIREKLINLEISEEDKKLLKQELAFLPREQQNTYIEEIYRLYKKDIRGF